MWRPWTSSAHLFVSSKPHFSPFFSPLFVCVCFVLFSLVLVSNVSVATPCPPSFLRTGPLPPLPFPSPLAEASCSLVQFCGVGRDAPFLSIFLSPPTFLRACTGSCSARVGGLPGTRLLPFLGVVTGVSFMLYLVAKGSCCFWWFLLFSSLLSSSPFLLFSFLLVLVLAYISFSFSLTIYSCVRVCACVGRGAVGLCHTSSQTHVHIHIHIFKPTLQPKRAHIHRRAAPRQRCASTST